MLQTTRNSPIPELSVWAPLVLAILRIVSALLLIDQHPLEPAGHTLRLAVAKDHDALDRRIVVGAYQRGA